MSDKKRIVTSYIAQAVSGIFGILFVPIYINYLGIEAYGIIGFLAVLQVWFILLDIGMAPTLGREMSRYSGGAYDSKSIRELLRTLELIVCIIAIIVCITIWSLSSWISENWLEGSESINLVLAIKIISFVVAMKFMDGLYHSALIGLHSQVWISYAKIIFSIIRHFGAVVLVMFISTSVVDFLLWQLIVSILTVIFYCLKVYLLLPNIQGYVWFSIEKLRSVKSFIGGMSLISLINLGLTQLDKFAVSYYENLETYGYYTFAATIAGSLHLLIGPITTTYYPKFVKLITEKNNTELVNNYHLSAMLVTAVTAPITSVLFFYMDDIITIWTHNKDLVENVSPIATLLLLGTFFNGMVWVPYQCQLAFGWVKLSFWINFSVLMIILPGWIILIPKYGVIAAAYLWVTINIFLVFLNAIFMHRKLLTKERGVWFRKAVFPGVLVFTFAYLSKQLSIILDYSGLINIIFIICVYLLLQYVVVRISKELWSKLLGLLVFKKSGI